MNPYLLEVCADSVESAICAQRGGAHRIELCANMVIGGTTPGIALFKEVRKHTELKIHVLIRPRCGDFLYSDNEFACMQREVDLFCDAGVDGIVIGCLNSDGSLNREQMEPLIEMAGDKRVTLHRAFDMCREPRLALEQALSMGVDTILTSGQKDNCLAGAQMIKELCNLADHRIEIMAGAGIDAETIPVLSQKIPALCYFHMSGKTIIPSAMEYRNEEVHMGLPGLSEYEIYRTDEKAIRRAIELLDSEFRSRGEIIIV